MRKAVIDAWIISMVAGLALCSYGYCKPGNPSLIDLANFESEIGTALDVRWHGPDLSTASTVGPFSSPLAVSFPLGFSSMQGFRSPEGPRNTD